MLWFVRWQRNLQALVMADDGVQQIGVLYRKWSKPLIGYVLPWTGQDYEEADGFVTEAFHEMFRKWNEVQAYDERRKYGWLRTVARNQAVSAYRRQRGMVELVDPVGMAHRLDTPSFEDEPVFAVLEREHHQLAVGLVEQCMAVIQAMPSHLRIALLLRGEGHTSREIGEEICVDPSTVRGYWKQAIQQIVHKVGDVIRILDDVEDPHNDGGENKA
jgi:RNA polymerase sigma factor (sigma-70 family)